MQREVCTTPSIPWHWIMRSVQGTYWIVPALPAHGWGLKRPYRGHLRGLKAVSEHEAQRAVHHANAGFDLARPDFAEYVSLETAHA